MQHQEREAEIVEVQREGGGGGGGFLSLPRTEWG